MQFLKVVAILGLFCLSLQTLADPRKLPLYVGRGYDLLEGNPLSNKVDPGFQQGIFRFNYDKQKTTDDDRYLIPDETQYHQVSSCLFSSNIQTYRGTQSYQQELKKKVSVETGYKGLLIKASFSASRSYEKIEKDTIQTNMTITHASAECQAYELSINLFQTPTFEDNFIVAVNQSYHTKNWARFITQFGTHYVYQVIMGGKAIQQISYESHSVSKLQSLNVEIQIAAKASFAAFYADASFDYKKYKEEISYVTNESKSISELYIGGQPQKNGDIKEWAERVKQNPMPISYKIILLSDLFKKVPGLTIDVPQAEKQFQAALEDYCKAKDCKIPVPDKPKPPPAIVSIYKTKSYGGTNGSPFENIHESPTLNAVKLMIRCGGRIDQIQLLLSDGIRSIYTPKFGGDGGSSKQFQVPIGQYISQVEYYFSDKIINGLVFITNKGKKSQLFGSTSGGGYHLEDFPEDYRIIGLFGKQDNVVDSLGFILGKTSYQIGQKSEQKIVKPSLSIQ